MAGWDFPRIVARIQMALPGRLGPGPPASLTWYTPTQPTSQTPEQTVATRVNTYG
jgi:hypothetical protein